MPVYSIDGITPVVEPGAFVHPTACLIGDVIVRAGVYIGPGVSLRGDFGRIVIGENSNVQDNCVMHTLPNADLIVEAEGHIGHSAVLHGCHVGRNVMIGIGAILLDLAMVGESSIVAAGALLKTNFSCPPRSLVIGNPAVVKRELSESELAWKIQATQQYKKLTARCLGSLQETRPLSAVETDRPRLAISGFKTLQDSRRH
ncbi:MAG: phenylacetic acid degradation protein PaaY [Gammaproteobacteria bacterium]|nr:MAG: phenylacetic acid degradation protein PaaY [Gammaproteobacteria bacterium]